MKTYITLLMFFVVSLYSDQILDYPECCELKNGLMLDKKTNQPINAVLSGVVSKKNENELCGIYIPYIEGLKDDKSFIYHTSDYAITREVYFAIYDKGKIVNEEFGALKELCPNFEIIKNKEIVDSFLYMK